MSCGHKMPLIYLQSRTEITQFLAVCGCGKADSTTALIPLYNDEKGIKK